MIESVPVGQLDRVVRELGGSLDVAVRWHGGDLARVLSARHAMMHEAIARWFRGLPGWIMAAEVSFSVYGERGVIDVLAWHASSRTVLVIELKTEIVDVGGLLAQVDRYRRLAWKIARDRGWQPERVATWVLLAPSRTNSRRLAEHATVIRAAFPDDGRVVSGWLAHPDRALACLSFLPKRLVVSIGRDVAGRRRVDRPRSSPSRAREVRARASQEPEVTIRTTEVPH
jgi:hypothetical protein